MKNRRAFVHVLLMSLCLALPVHAESTFEREIARLSELLELESGSMVADVGAGDGEYAIALAEVVGPGGRVFATELGEEDLEKIAANAQEADATTVSVVQAGVRETGLPAECCDGAFLRGVYHHVTDPTEFDASLFASIKPGGRLVILDFPPSFWLALSAPDNVPADREGHGVRSEIVVRELEAAGFVHQQTIVKWESHNFITKFYAAVFERPSE